MLPETVVIRLEGQVADDESGLVLTDLSRWFLTPEALLVIVDLPVRSHLETELGSAQFRVLHVESSFAVLSHGECDEANGAGLPFSS